MQSIPTMTNLRAVEKKHFISTTHHPSKVTAKLT
jgi:hypothetical protein